MPIAQFSETGKNIRLDAEFFSTENQKLMSLLKKHELIKLGDCALYIKDMGKFSLYKSEYLKDKGIPFLRATNIKSNFIDFSDTVFIEEEYHNKLKNSQVQPKDILLTTKGVIGISACLSAEIGQCNMSQNLVRIAVNTNLVNPYFISAFLNSKYGRFQTKRLASGNMQPYLNFENIRQVLIPKFPIDFQNKIEKQIKQLDLLKKQAEKLLQSTEKLLLSEIGLDNLEIIFDNSKILRFRESVNVTKRLDAEYYQEKFRFIEENIQKYSSGFNKLEEIANIKDQNFLPERDKKYKYIELASLDKNGNINDVNNYLGKNLPNRAKRLVKKGDVIISSIEGSLDKVAIIPAKLDGAICSTAFYVLQSFEINSETIFTFFKSKILQNLLKKACSGTILISANRQDFGSILFPKIKNEVQNRISKQIKTSIKLQTTFQKKRIVINDMITNKILEK